MTNQRGRPPKTIKHEAGWVEIHQNIFVGNAQDFTPVMTTHEEWVENFGQVRRSDTSGHVGVVGDLGFDKLVPVYAVVDTETGQVLKIEVDLAFQEPEPEPDVPEVIGA